MGKIILSMCVYNVYAYVYVCTLCVCKCRPHLPSTHLEVRTQALSLLFTAHRCVCWRGGQYASMEPPVSTCLVMKAPRWQAHAIMPSMTWVLELCMHDLMLTYWAISPPLFLFTYFFFLWILWIYAEFMGYSHLMVGIHLGKVSSGDFYHAMNSTENTYLMWTLDESNTWCTLHTRGCC